VLYLAEKYRKEAMCEAHYSIFGGHNATQKTYLKISTSYFWPKMFHYIIDTKIRCQQPKKSISPKTPLAPLPIPECPNLQIHADLFGPMIADSNKYLCYASRMFLQNMLWSWRWQIKRQRQ
jgi:Integrase zinc binding domain